MHSRFMILSKLNFIIGYYMRIFKLEILGYLTLVSGFRSHPYSNLKVNLIVDCT
jgi:hypothetical protein